MNLTEKEMAEFEKAFNSDVRLYRANMTDDKAYDGVKRYILGSTLSKILARKAGVAWSTGGHTAQKVLTTAKGCKAEIFNEPMDNTDIAKKIKSFYGK